MGKVKIKRKSTLIDMTAMSDVTVLLLTFFMLTSTFLQKEPATVITPSSVSEKKVPTSNLVTILVSGAGVDKDGSRKTDVEGKVFISIAGDVDSTFSSENVRAQVFQEAVRSYNETHKNKIQITPAQVAAFSKINMFGLKLSELPSFLSLDASAQDEVMKHLEDPKVGIPIDDNRDLASPNEFQIWMRAIYNVARDMDGQGSTTFFDALQRSGEGIAVKADKDTPYSTIHHVLDNLQTLKFNKFSLMTALTSEEE